MSCYFCVNYSAKLLFSRSWNFKWQNIEFSKLVLAALVLGAVNTINAWDYPTQILIFSAAVLISEYIKRKGFNLMLLVHSSWKIVMVILLSILFFLPYHQNYETFFYGITATTHTTDFLENCSNIWIPTFISNFVLWLDVL